MTTTSSATINTGTINTGTINTGTTNTGGLGEILRPGSDEFDRARHVWNGTIDRYPALIARCRTTAEVAAAVRMANESGLEIAVRGGGHSIPGHSVCEGGLMIDLSPMRRVEVDPVERVAESQPGVLWAEYDAATQEHGLASPGGEVSHTGVAGLTLGGGIGWLSRRHGLACDNLTGAEIVLADGSTRWVDDERDPDLMWGLRGGGGNFGIVTRFRFRVHPVQPLLSGILMWPADRASMVMERFIETAEAAADDLSLVVARLVAPPAPFVPEHLQLRPAVAVAACWTGVARDGDAAVRSMRSMRPDVDTFDIHAYTDIQRWFDDGVPHGRRYHVRSEWLGAVDSDASAELMDSADRASSPFNQVLLRRVGGAISDVAHDATAFRYRDATYMLTVASGWDSGNDQPHVEWTHDTWARMRPWSCGGGYVNHLAADEGADRVRAAYGASTWDRLVALKRIYDPANVFHLNQNIDPS